MSKKNNVLGNSVWSIIQQAFSIISSFLIGIIVARYLGTEKTGIIGVGNSLIAIISSVSWLGIDSILVNEIIKDNKRENEVVWTSLITKFISNAVLLGLVYFIVRFLYVDEERVQFVVLIVGIGSLFQCYESIVYWFQSKLLVKYTSIVTIISQIITLVYQVYIIITNRGIYYFAAVSLIQNAIMFCILLILFIAMVHKKPIFRFDVLKSLFINSYHYIISSLAVTLYMQIDKVMIGKMISNSHAGVYNIGVNVAVVWQIIPIAIINSFRPIILELKKNNDDDYLEVFKSLNLFISVISIFFCIIFCLFADIGVYLFYGNDYIDAAGPLKITVWATMISMLGVVRGIWLVAENYNRYDKYFTIIAAIINILLNIVFIKQWGIIGAALATVISYFIEVFVVVIFFKETRNYLQIFLSSFVEWRRMLSIVKEYFVKEK